MSEKDKWLYFNIHDLVRIRVEAGHASERSIRLVFGLFETEPLEECDLTLQYDEPEMGEHSFASESYLYTDHHVYIKDYKLHLVNQNDQFVLASKRDLLPYVFPVIQWLLLNKRCSIVHAASVAVEGRGVLLPGWGGTGKTSAIVSLLKEIPKCSFLGDDYTILSAEGRLLSFPKAFFIYPYHRELFPHLFSARHKPLIPPILSGIVERIRTVVRPTIMAFPRLENLARRFTPEHMQIPARTALPDAEFSNNVPLECTLFVERYSGKETVLDKLETSDVRRRLIGNWYYEQGRCAQDLVLGAGGTGVMDIEGYLSKMLSVISSALGDKEVFRLRFGKMEPGKIGKTIVEVVREMLAG
jgi:hypothetical protein